MFGLAFPCHPFVAAMLKKYNMQLHEFIPTHLPTLPDLCGLQLALEGVLMSKCLLENFLLLSKLEKSLMAELSGSATTDVTLLSRILTSLLSVCICHAAICLPSGGKGGSMWGLILLRGQGGAKCSGFGSLFLIWWTQTLYSVRPLKCQKVARIWRPLQGLLPHTQPDRTEEFIAATSFLWGLTSFLTTQVLSWTL